LRCIALPPYGPAVAVTLSDLASALGISAATASRALNGRPGVSDDVRERVLAAAHEQGYSRSEARSSTPAGALVGVIVPELDNPVFPAFAQVMTTMLVEQGHAPMLCTQGAPGIGEDTWLELLLRRDTAGIIVVSGMHADTHASPERYQRLRRRGLPLVLVNGYVPDLDATFLSVDDAAAMDFAVEHLVSLGHRRIGLAVGPERYVPVIRKTEGYTRALERRSAVVDPTPLVATSTFSIEGGFSATSRLLDSGVTAVICASDLMALGAIRAVRSRGLTVPGDVSVIGFDDSTFDAYTDPPLTSLRQPVRAMATAAVRALLEELRNDVYSRSEFLFPPELVVRSSTSAAPVAAVRRPRSASRPPRSERPPRSARSAAG